MNAAVFALLNLNEGPIDDDEDDEQEEEQPYFDLDEYTNSDTDECLMPLPLQIHDRMSSLHNHDIDGADRTDQTNRPGRDGETASNIVAGPDIGSR